MQTHMHYSKAYQLQTKPEFITPTGKITNIKRKTFEKCVTCSVVKMTNCCESATKLVLHLNKHR